MANPSENKGGIVREIADEQNDRGFSRRGTITIFADVVCTRVSKIPSGPVRGS